MILILGASLKATPWHYFWSPIILNVSLQEEACSNGVREHKSPWQQRWPCECTTPSPRVLKVSALYYKSKKNTTCTVTRATGGKDLTIAVALGVTNRQFYMQLN